MHKRPAYWKNKPIYWYETIKIRNILKTLHRPMGYPVKFEAYVGYYSGVSIWIPNGWIIHSEQTTISWFDYMGYEIYPYQNNAKVQPLREVAIWFIGQETAGIVQSLIPLSVESGLADYLSSMTTMKKLEIYENSVFFDTMNDAVIFANWDKIWYEIEQAGE